MIISPYETTICKPYKKDAIQRALETANIQDPFPAVGMFAGTEYTNVKVVTPAPEYSDVAPFTQPVFLKDGTVVFDGRSFLGSRPENGKYPVRVSNDYGFQILRAQLMLAFAGKDFGALVSLQENAWRFFDQWVSSTLVVRTNLANNFDIRVRVSVVIAAYFITRFYENPEKALSEELDAITAKITRWLRIPQTTVEEVLARVEGLTDFDSLARNLFEATQAIRLKGLNYQGFYTMLSGSWFGVHARENVGVALEHLPTFYAIAFTALNDRSYKKTAIGSRIDQIRDPAIKGRFDTVIRRVVKS